MVKIYEIQGEGHTSPLLGDTVTAEGGIVTAVVDNGFYIQDPIGDDNQATSDGLFIFTNSVPTVSVGDEVDVTGEVSEFQPGGEDNRNLTQTQIAFPDNIEVLSQGNQLPNPVIIGNGGRIPPSENIDEDAFSEFNPSEAGIDFFESLEAMLATAQDAVAVAPTNRFGEIFTVVDGGENATGISDRGTLNISEDDFNPEKVQIDFESDLLPDFDFPQVNVGAQLGDVTGVIGYDFGNFQIFPTEEFTVTPNDLQPETTAIQAGDETLTVAAYNVLNLDPNDDDGEDTDVADGRFDAIAAQIVNNLNTPDVIGLQEIQDNDGEDISDVSAADETLQLLIDRIVAAGGPTYEFIDTEGIVPAFIDENGDVVRPTGGAPGGNIRNAFLYNPERVTLVDSEPLTDPQDQATNPENPFFGSRIPLSATFEFNGQEVTVISNHLSSKGGSSAILGLDQPFEELQNGEQKDLPQDVLDELPPADRFVNGSYNERETQAQAVKEYVDNLDADNIVALGDFNEFEFVDPVEQILGSSLTNLVDTIPADERYSFIFQGNSQQLDHILVSDNLAEQAEIDIVHTNVEFPSTPARASDHEPLLASINLPETDDMAIEINPIGTFRTGIFDEGAAEIVAHDPITQSLFVINSDAVTVDILNVSDPTNPVANPMTEAQEVADVPVPDGPATGDFIWTLTGNELSVRGTFSGLSSDLFQVGGEDVAGNPESAIHVHTGVAGENGPILRNLTVNPTGDGRSGTFEGEFTLTDEELDSLDGLYVNLHTENFNGGEIRGQLIQPSIDATSFGDGANSIAVENGFAAVAIEGEAVDDNGQVLVFSTADGNSTTFDVGVLPDMVTFTPDGSKILVANEGEPSEDYTIDPEGSISIIDATTGEVSTADFTAFNDQKEALINRGVRIFGPGATVAQDLEPEYITVTPDGSTAYVSLQENNALAVVDIENAEVVDILPLGFKDHSKGLPTLETFEISDEVLAANPLLTPDGPSDIPLGGLSGLFFEGVADNGNLQFITHPDRGPDLGSRDTDGDGENDVRTFALPDFQPTLYRFEFNQDSGDITFTDNIALTRADGTPLTGLPNLEGDDSDRQGEDPEGNLLDFDPFGADMEGVVVNPADGTFWTVDEYRPSIYHFDTDGTLLDRFVPAGTDPDENETFGSETLPEEYLSARDNRGFEAVSLDTETGILYAFIQTPLGNDGTNEFNSDVSANSSVIRMLGIDPATGEPVAEYVYLLEKPAFSEGNVDKIGAATFAGDGKFFVVERDSGTEPTSNKVVYEINLSGATDVLGQTFEGTTLEQLTADELAAEGIRPVSKTEVTNLPSLGYLTSETSDRPSDKPEGLALLPDGSLAVLNDNDFEPESKATSLGIISFDQSNELDPSDADRNGINFQNIPSFGMYQPDAIASFETDGRTFILTANEGDARDYDGFSEEVGLDDLLDDGLLDLNDDNVADTGDTVTSTGETVNDLLADNRLGELDFTNATGDIDGDGLIEQLHNYGGRSFSVFDEFGNLVFDSGDEFERIVAQELPRDFNANNDENGSFDSRSDAKGPEPEAIVTGVVDGTTYAFIGLERVGGVMVYDLSDPSNPQFIEYVNNRTFRDSVGEPIPVQLEDGSVNPAVDDLGPEGFDFIPAAESPNGEALLAVGNEVSGTTTLYSITDMIEPPQPTNEIELAVAGTFETGVFDEGAAEIVAYDAGTERLFVINSDAVTVDILDVSDPTNPNRINQIDATEFGAGANSVAVQDGIVAVAIEASEIDGNGQVVFFDTDGTVLNSVEVGILPDMVTFSPDGMKVLTANEAEPSEDYTIDPEGSISIIDISNGVENATVNNAGFTSFNDQQEALEDSGVRIFGPGATVAQDLEPEYIAVSPDSSTAYVSLQENNAFAVVDLNAGEVTEILPLGFKNHSEVGNKIDPSANGEINIQNVPTFGIYQPDAIATFETNGETYIITANEGDTRDYDGFSEEGTISDLQQQGLLDLNDDGEADAADDLPFADLNTSDQLGNLLLTNATGDVDDDGLIEQLYSVGGRSFAIFNESGELIFESGEDFERIVAEQLPEGFNTTNDENDSFDDRSSDKGPEPEAVVVGEVDGTPYAFIGLERVGGVMVYNVSEPTDPQFVQYINNRNFDVPAQLEDGSVNPAAGDLGPEGFDFISAEDSPTGQALLAVGNEVSGTTTLYTIGDLPTPIEGTEGADNIEGTDGDDIINALGGDDIVNALGGNDTVDPGAGNDIVDLGAGNDTFIGGNGDNIADGGDGDDTAVYTGNFADTPVAVIDETTIEVGDNTDTLTNFEFLEFDDQTVNIDDLDDDDTFTLELLHAADQEGGINAVSDAPRFSAVLNALRNEDLGNDGEPDNTLTLSSGDAFIPGVFFQGSEGAFGSPGIGDIQIQNELGFQAITLGNHEFDFGTEVLAGLIDGSAEGEILGSDFTGANFPYLSANLDFSGDENLAPLEVEGAQAPQPNSVTSSVVIDVNGENIGVVGATTPTLASISSPDGVTASPSPFDTPPTSEQLDALAAEIQTEVDALLAANQDINKVILSSHMQQLSIEQGLAERLENVDIIIGGGSNTRLFDENDRVRDGDTNQGEYPQFFTNAGGTQTALVNTDGSYKYVGRLVLDFDSEGNIIPESYDPVVSGAFATDEQGVTDLNAEDLVDPEVQQIADAIEQEIIAAESNVFGISEVFLNGNRSGGPLDGVRTQETNLGNLTADANLAAAQDADEEVVLSLKNGGGIRASIGEIIVPPGGSEAVRSPNQELVDSEGNLIKPEGGISQVDIDNTLAFNNNLTLLTLTKEEIVDLLEHGVSALPEVAGQFPQIGGAEFSFDPELPAGDRIVEASIVDDEDNTVAELVSDGEIVGDPSETFRLVTLGFLANPRFDDDGNFTGGGDGYPFPNTNDDPEAGEVGDADVIARVNRVDLDTDGVNDGATGDATFADDGTEQDALAEYLLDNFPPDDDPNTPVFSQADTPVSEDDRIINLAEQDIDDEDPTPAGDRVFRFFNTETGGHLYTADVAEREFITNTLPEFELEGVAFLAAQADDENATDVFRFFNEEEGQHFYTTSEEEKDFVENNLPNFVFEGVAFSAYEEELEETTAVFRFFNAGGGGHFYTASTEESDFLQDNAPEFAFEGVGFYANDISEGLLA